MNSLKGLDLVEIKAWLERQPLDAIVGTTWKSNKCLIATYAKDVLDKEVEVHLAQGYHDGKEIGYINCDGEEYELNGELNKLGTSFDAITDEDGRAVEVSSRRALQLFGKVMPVGTDASHH